MTPFPPIQINSIPTPLMAWKSTGGTPPAGDGIELENGSGVIALEGSGIILLE